MQEIPATYWMIIIGVIAIFICLVLFYLILLIRESREAVKESKEVLRNSKNSILRIERITENLEATTDMARATMEEISTKVLTPFRTIAGFMNTIGDFVSKKFEKEEIEEEVTIEDLLNE